MQLFEVQLTQEIRRKGAELLGGLDQPVQHGVGVNLEDPGRRADPQALSQTGQDVYDAFHFGVFAVEERAVMFGKVALARGAVQLPPGAAMRMAIGAEIAQPEPAAIATAYIGSSPQTQSVRSQLKN